MAPACVVLNRTVAFRDHPLEKREPLGEAASGVVGGNIPAPSRWRHRSFQGKQATVEKYLRAMKADLQVVDPPGVSRLTMGRPHSSDPIPQFGRHVDIGFVAAADKSLVVVYARRRGSYSESEWYLVLDFASSSPRSFTIPSNDCPGSYKCGGLGSTFITPLPPDSFILAKLLFSLRHPSQGLSSAMICLWNTHSCCWDYKQSTDLPAEVCHAWTVHKSFHVQSRRLLCWVDLLHGLLLCDLHEVHSELLSCFHTCFVPLPPNTSSKVFDPYQGLLSPADLRTMADVDGTIKFFALDDLADGNQISLVTYSLDFDGPSKSPVWTKDTVVRLNDLWADETYISMGLPRVTPSFPILSTQEHGVVYLVIPSDVEVDQEDGCLIRRVQFLLSVDTRKTRVVSATQQNLPRTLFGSRFLITFDAASQLSSKGAVEAIGMGSSRKKIKFATESCAVGALDDHSLRCVM